MQTKPKNSKLAAMSAEEAYLSGLLEVVDLALTTTIRRGFESVDLSDEDERLDVLLRFYSFATMLLAEEAHAWGIVDPLDQLQVETGMLREGYPELKSTPAPRTTDDGRRSR
jgi:hypothetical protein